ncbi:MAG TPA: malectin domain-containing carbohydrate-binding protein [Terrimicrobiaceae bacterium]
MKLQNESEGRLRGGERKVSAIRVIGILALCFLAEVVAISSAKAAVSFSISTLQGVTTGPVTSLEFGPDNRLYFAQVNGEIKACTVQRFGPNQYNVVATETINLVKNIPNYDDDGTRNFALNTRQVTGLLVTGTAENPVLYVSSSDPRIGAGSGGHDLKTDTNSGIISRLTWTGSEWDKVDIVRGLPRSEENHATNGMQFDFLSNALLVAQGGNANAGGPSVNFAFLCETALSAAVLSVDLTAIEAMPVQTDIYGQKYLYDLPTVNDPNSARAHNPDGSDVNDPFGGNDGLNQAKLVPGGPVQVYASGFRNPYDVVITKTPGREGRLYSFDNGANPGWGGYPKNEGPAGNVTNEYLSGEPGFVNNLDNLHFITGPGFYGGHPNPIRANPAGAGWFHFDNDAPTGQQMIFSPTPTSDWPPVPASMANPVEGDFKQPGTADSALLTYTASTNGLAEYVAMNFNGEMQGNLIAAAYDGKLLRVELSQDGTQVVNGVQVLASGFGNLPLDVTTPRPGKGTPFVGTIWVSHYAPAKLSVLEPSDFDSPGGSTCLGIDDFEIDEDGDGYSNGDEIANGSDPCSASIRPPDADGDFVSDFVDSDDDNDGLGDTEDPFQIDVANGGNIPLPLRYDLFNDLGVGFFGVGMTGVMMNPGEDYLLRYDLGNIVAGGTAGLFTISFVGPGTAYGSANSQMDAFQFGFHSDEFIGPYVIRSSMGGPFFGGQPQGNQSQGIYIGNGDQDNYVKIALHANSGPGAIEVVHERDGVVISQNLYSFPGLLAASVIDLFFAVDPIAGTVQPRFSFGGSSAVADVGPAITVEGKVLAAMKGTTPLAVGLIATSSGASAPAFAATWDFFEILPVSNTAIAKITIDPPGNDIKTASTYNFGSFKIENLSTGGQKIQSVSYDLRTSILPDVVFDPLGTAGDTVSKGFQVNSNSGTGLIGGIFELPHNGVNGQDGYDGLKVSFNQFAPGGVLTFSTDIDPTTIKGSPGPGPGDSGSVSGLEMIGAVVTVTFDDGSTRKVRVSRIPGSVDASQGLLSSSTLPTPTISVPGQTSPFATGVQPTVRVVGPAGLTATLLVSESALYLQGLANGGYDVDPWEANSVIALQELSTVIPAAGYVDIPVTLTKSEADGGNNRLSAILTDSSGNRSAASNTLVIQYQPPDTQAPTVPGSLSAANTTATGVTLNWTASTDNVAVTGYKVSRDGVLIATVTGLSYSDSGLSPSTSYAYTVVAQDAAGNVSSPASLSVTTAGSSPGVIRVNAGGGTYVDTLGNTWSADFGFNTGQTFTVGNAIAGTVEDTLYKTERYDKTGGAELAYAFSMSNGEYLVKLHFAETYPGTSAVGKRVFDVKVEGALALDNLDIFSRAGANTALILTVAATVSDGQLNIEFLHGAENPKICAIEVLPGGAADTEAPTTPGSLSATNTTPNSLTLNWTASTDNFAVTGYQVYRDGLLIATVSGLSYNDSGLSPNTAYAYTVAAQDAAGNLSAPASLSVTTPGTPVPGSAVVRVNAGGGMYVDSLGNTWSADFGFNTGVTYSVTSAIAGTIEDTLYKTERYDSAGGAELAYAFSLPNGQYLVKLHFAETYPGTSSVGKRVFDVKVEGALAIDNLDIFSQAGANAALILTVPVTISDGQLNIEFLHGVQNPKICAIEVLVGP